MTAAAVATPELTPPLVKELAELAGRPEFPALQRQLKGTGWCARPVRLRGEVCDQHGTRLWSTATEPNGVLRKACGNRREAVCPSCADRYRQDAYHLISAGLRGGKGIPNTVIEHPMIFATLTAPSFGPVHTRALGADGKPRRCRPRRDKPVCEHGHPAFCNEIHGEDDPKLGQPICQECFDHGQAVLWNNHLGELWRRTTIYLPRKLALMVGATQKQTRRWVRVSYVKVAEYQRRGLVHLHVVIRLDRAMPKERAHDVRPPEAKFTTELLEDALRAAAADVTVPVADELGGGFLTWGEQLDVKHIGAGQAFEPGRCAGYLAKYATKATEQAGGVLHPVKRSEVDDLKVREHPRELIRQAFKLDDKDPDRNRRQEPGEPEPRPRRLAQNAHNLGYRGHCLTKSRRYSTTFKRLRQAREDHRLAELRANAKTPEAQRRLAGLDREDRQSRFTFVGVGHLTTAEANLAARAAAAARESRELARIERSGTRTARGEEPCRVGVG